MQIAVKAIGSVKFDAGNSAQSSRLTKFECCVPRTRRRRFLWQPSSERSAFERAVSQACCEKVSPSKALIFISLTRAALLRLRTGRPSMQISALKLRTQMGCRAQKKMTGRPRMQISALKLSTRIGSQTEKRMIRLSFGGLRKETPKRKVWGVANRRMKCREFGLCRHPLKD